MDPLATQIAQLGPGWCHVPHRTFFDFDPIDNGHDVLSVSRQVTCPSAVVGLMRYTAKENDPFVDALKLFKIGYSWAGPVSLVVPYDLKAMRGDKAYPGTLVRFSIGLESAVALKADLAQALAVLG